MEKDLISRSALLAALRERQACVKNVCSGCEAETLGWAMKCVEEAPAVDAALVRHGYWIEMVFSDNGKNAGYKCSKCGRGSARKYVYCHCGAKMDAEVEEC